ncbi:NAD-dependent epimerase/dehydratase family protein [Kitasatospora cineracea]|uniref:UDP-glucose 4-epimerase n=1 Tax=Kitasatospora cineracea TaxID=88074 RepID=A0A3N4RL09_9ACTN|nr:NAD-dependent epimerase/dehydratase family protein [Kitasatospora cineracea]ROR43765.1 UDP-glucose 4-epimerase [Kitasatospora cineracea]RPE34108.1 UDP-glucose 4-epimerase [Kitasatospora cineracea]
MGKVVLVTGVARPLGARFAERIAERPDVDRVVGVDAAPPPTGLPPGVRYAQVDPRRPAIARVIAEHEVDTVVHLNVTALGHGGRAAVKESNVIGTMQLLGACQQAPGLGRLVVKSTTAVYGSAPRDPAVFGERMQPKALPPGGFARDAAEVEGYVRGFARRRPDVAVTVLRFANILGPDGDTPLAAYFRLPVLPTAFGHDPRLQFVHEDDALEALRLAALGAPTGTYNVAGDGVLLLSQCARRLGRPTVPLLRPALGLVAQLARQLAAPADRAFSQEQLQLLTHGRVVDTAQLRDRYGWAPRWTTPETFADFVAHSSPGPLPPERLTAVTDRLAGLLGNPHHPTDTQELRPR